MPIHPPNPPLGDHLVNLSPLTDADVNEIDGLSDVLGFRELAMGNPISAEQIRQQVARGVSGWTFPDPPEVLRMNYLRWGFSVRLRRSLVGMLGFEWFTIEPNDDQAQSQEAVAVFYWTASDHRGHGYAARALSLATPWAMEAFGVSDIWLRPNNEASIAVAIKAGYLKTSRVLFGEQLFVKHS